MALPWWAWMLLMNRSWVAKGWQHSGVRELVGLWRAGESQILVCVADQYQNVEVVVMRKESACLAARGTPVSHSVCLLWFLYVCVCFQNRARWREWKWPVLPVGAGSGVVWALPLIIFSFLPSLPGASGKYTSGPKNCGIHLLHSLASYCRYCPQLPLFAVPCS